MEAVFSYCQTPDRANHRVYMQLTRLLLPLLRRLVCRYVTYALIEPF